MKRYMKSVPVVQEEMTFKEKVYGRWTDGQRLITKAQFEPSPQVS